MRNNSIGVEKLDRQWRMHQRVEIIVQNGYWKLEKSM